MTQAKKKLILSLHKANKKLNMNTTISITPRAFGNIAAAAMAHGCDVTTFLIRAATARAAAPAPAPVPSTPATATPEPAPAPQPMAAPSSGMFDL